MTVLREGLGRQRALRPFSTRQGGARGYGRLHWVDQENPLTHTRRQTRTIGRKEQITWLSSLNDEIADACAGEVMQMNGVALRNRQPLRVGRGGHRRDVFLHLQRDMLEGHRLFP